MKWIIGLLATIGAVIWWKAKSNKDDLERAMKPGSEGILGVLIGSHKGRWYLGSLAPESEITVHIYEKGLEFCFPDGRVPIPYSAIKNVRKLSFGERLEADLPPENPDWAVEFRLANASLQRILDTVHPRPDDT